MLKTKYALIGGGPAAVFAADAIRKRDKEGNLVMLSAEKYPPYFRPLISYFLAGLVPEERLFLRNEDFYRRHRIQVLRAKVTGVQGEERVLFYELLNGEDSGKASRKELNFEKLLIASGADPVKPDIPGVESPGVFCLRTLTDAREIAAWVKGRKKAVLLGGGLVSLRAASALKKLGLKVTLVISSSQVLSQMLDKEGGEVVARHLEKNGIKIIFNREASQIHSGERGVEAVSLTGGETLAAEAVVVGKGVKPAVSFLGGSGIEHSWGVTVNERLQSNLPDVYAAGDAAFCQDLLLKSPAVNALWYNAIAQGEIAGANMAGERLIYRGSMGMNATEFFGMPVIAAGLARLEKEEGPYKIYRQRYPSSFTNRPAYAKFVFQDNFLAGYIIIGASQKAGLLTHLIMSQKPLSDRRREQLVAGKIDYLG